MFYRASTCDKAVALGLTGWVRNLPDGRVEAVACGSTAALAALEAWLWQGPPQAQVSAVASREEKPQGWSAFEVR